MIRRVVIRNFKLFRDLAFELEDSLVLAGPNNSGKTTLLQALVAWKFGLERWMERQSGGQATQRTGASITRKDFTPVPLREMNLLWQGRQVAGSAGMSGKRKLVEIQVEGVHEGVGWDCGVEYQYLNQEMMHVRPLGGRDMKPEAIRAFPPEPARNLEIVHVPALSGIELDEPRRERGLQNLLVGQGLPGRILRNLLWEIADNQDRNLWKQLAGHVMELFHIRLKKPSYAPAQPFIICEYRSGECKRPLDLSNLGSGAQQVILLLAFLHARPASLILLDEPDAHLHVILQSQVLDRIRRIAHDRRGQLIIATHSATILDNTPPQRVMSFLGAAPCLLEQKSQRDQVRQALGRITTTEQLLAREVGGILYLEGHSDRSILDKWIRILDHPLREFFDRPFVHILGGRNLKEARDHFFALKAVVSHLRAVCLLDGDNREEDDKIGEEFMLIRWRRHAIENYLLIPEAITRFVEGPLFKGIVDEEFRKLVPRGTSLFGDHAALVRSRAMEEFFDPLFGKVGMSILKRDMHLLAARMLESEIHPEVKEKLDLIADRLGSCRDSSNQARQ